GLGRPARRARPGDRVGGPAPGHPDLPRHRDASAVRTAGGARPRFDPGAVDDVATRRLSPGLRLRQGPRDRIAGGRLRRRRHRRARAGARPREQLLRCRRVPALRAGPPPPRRRRPTRPLGHGRRAGTDADRPRSADRPHPPVAPRRGRSLARRLGRRACRHRRPREDRTMKTVYTDDHRFQDGQAELIDGKLQPCFEMPKRADIIIGRVREVGLGEVVPPRDFGLDPIRRVHKENFVEFLRTAWDAWVAAHGAYDALPLNWMARGMRSIEPESIDGKLSYYSFD